MSLIEIKNYNFKYPGRDADVLSGISVDIENGDFVLVCGASGSGKTTLLKNIKPELRPAGDSDGSINISGKEISSLSATESARGIGFVMQDPDNQIVMDSVWLELAFGLENLAVPSEEIGRRIGEIAGFFGITSWFGKSVNALSGGQKQILNLASVIAMQADIIILDEPTSQLDPIAAKEFLQMLKRVNIELGKTIIMSEHRLEDTLSLCDNVLYLEKGSLGFYGNSRDYTKYLGQNISLPAPTRLALRCGENNNKNITTENIPLDVREGRRWLKSAMETADFSVSGSDSNYDNKIDSTPACPGKDYPISAGPESTDNNKQGSDILLSCRDLWYRYEKAEAFVLQGLETNICAGMIHAFVGGNGSGKSTLMKLLAGVLKPLKGKVKKTAGKKVGLLPQDTKDVFVCDRLADDLREHLPGLPEEQAIQIAKRLGIDHLLEYHPYDLSGGEMQKAALAKVLLTEPDILLLDEPCKGLDAFARAELAEILHEYAAKGAAVAFVTHDIEFTAEHADRCSMLFGSAIIAEDKGREFFGRNMFYTTSINRMTRGLLEGCILESDIVCGQKYSRYK